MKLAIKLTFITLLAWTGANEITHYGTLSITSVDKSIIDQGVVVVDDVLHENDKFSTFSTDSEGNIVLFTSGVPLGVNKDKKVAVGEQQYDPVSFGRRFSKDKWQLQAKDTTIFSLCGDGSIGLNSVCEGARDVLLFFDKLL